MGLCYSKPPRRGRRSPSHLRYGSGAQVRQHPRNSIYATPIGPSHYYTTLPSEDSIEVTETYSSNLYRPTSNHREMSDLRSSRMTTNTTSGASRIRAAEQRRAATRSSRRSSTRRSHRSSRYRSTSSKTYGNSRSHPTTAYSGRTLVENDPRSDYWDWALASHRFPLDQDEYRSLTGRSYDSSARTSKATMSSYSNYRGFAAPAPPRRYRVVVR